ncbi:MAG: HNH endonuclease [Dehalococcoidia bacterium]
MSVSVVVHEVVLVLNQNYEPLNVCNFRRAVVLLLKGRAEALENGRGEIRTVTSFFPLPSVIRLGHMIKRPLLMRRMSRREVFVRDRYVCQYCGRETRDLTLDHVTPRRMGGTHTWQNVVSACEACNRRKAGRTPAQAGMALRRNPGTPPPNRYGNLQPYLETRQEWRKFLPS